MVSSLFATYQRIPHGLPRFLTFQQKQTVRSVKKEEVHNKRGRKVSVKPGDISVPCCHSVSLFERSLKDITKKGDAIIEAY